MNPIRAIERLFDRATPFFVWLFAQLERVWVLIATPLRPVAEPIGRALEWLFAPLLRRRAKRRARQLDDLAALVASVGLPDQAGKLMSLAAQWRLRT